MDELFAAQLAHVNPRSFWARLFGGAGKPYTYTRSSPTPTT